MRTSEAGVHSLPLGQSGQTRPEEVASLVRHQKVGSEEGLEREVEPVSAVHEHPATVTLGRLCTNFRNRGRNGCITESP